MGLAGDIFYDLAADLVDVFVEDGEERLFYITEMSRRPFAHPSEVTRYEVPMEVPIKCTPAYGYKDDEDTGGVSRDDVTSKRRVELWVFVAERHIPENIKLEPQQNVRIEIEEDGRRLLLLRTKPIKDSNVNIARILGFGV